MEKHQAIHEKAVRYAANFLKSEALLLDALIEVRSHRVYQLMGYRSLFEYGVEALKLPEGQVYNFTRVAEKSKTLPLVHKAIKDGVLNVSKTRRILSVVTPETQAEWITKTSTLKQRQLEEAVVKERPESIVKDRIKPVSETKVTLTVTLSKEDEKNLKRVQDLESQRQKKAINLEATMHALMEAYLEKHDPERKAQRAIKRPAPEKSASRTTSGRAAVPAAVMHQLTLRDRSQCTDTKPDGTRCEQRRWLDTHHLTPVSLGGKNTLENLTTLCSFHHQQVHDRRM